MSCENVSRTQHLNGLNGLQAPVLQPMGHKAGLISPRRDTLSSAAKRRTPVRRKKGTPRSPAPTPSAQLRQRCNEYKARVDELEQRLQSTKATAKQVVAKSVEGQRQLAQMREQVLQLQHDVASAQQEVAVMRDQRDALQQQLQQATTSDQHSQQEAQRLRSQLGAAEARLASMACAVSQMQEERRGREERGDRELMRLRDALAQAQSNTRLADERAAGHRERSAKLAKEVQAIRDQAAKDVTAAHAEMAQQRIAHESAVQHLRSETEAGALAHKQKASRALFAAEARAIEAEMRSTALQQQVGMLQREVPSLRQRLFWSLALTYKVQLAAADKVSRVPVHEVWNKVNEDNVPVEQWEAFISQNLEC